MTGRTSGLVALLVLFATVVATPASAQDAQVLDSLLAAMDSTRLAGDSLGLAEAHNGYGIALWEEARYDSAVAHLQEARALWTALDDSVGMGRVNNNLGAAHYQWGNLGLALDSFLRSVEVRRALGDARGTALALTNVGLVYHDWRLHQRARDALEEAVVFAEETDDPFVSGYATHTRGVVLLGLGDARGARRSFQESLRIYQDDPRLTPAQSQSGWGINVHGLATVELFEGNPEAAVELLEDLFGGRVEDARTGRQAQALVDLGRAYQAVGRSDRALATLELALRLSREAAQRPLALETLWELSLVHEAKGEAREALDYARSYDALRDSLSAQSGAQQEAALEAARHAEDQVRENLRLREEQDRRDAVIARQRLGFLLGGALLMLSVILAVTLVHFNRKGRERERLLADANQELREALSEVRTLKGLIPICARCKKVRDDRGFWESVETYIASRSDASFSHGICAECGPELYGDDWVHEDGGGVPGDPSVGGVDATQGGPTEKGRG